MEKEKKPIYKKWWFWVIIAIVIIAIFGGNSENNTATNETTSITNNELDEGTITFLENSKGKETFEILCEVGNITLKDGAEIGDSIVYTSSNGKYSVDVETNKSDEICNVQMMAFSEEDHTNFFVSASRIEYNGANRNEAFNWIKDNLGKEATTKIGEANFKLYIGNNGQPILDIFTDGNEQYQKEQLEKTN